MAEAGGQAGVKDPRPAWQCPRGGHPGLLCCPTREPFERAAPMPSVAR